MYSGDENDELCSVDRFRSINPNYYKKKHKNNQMVRKNSSAIRREELVFNSIRSVRQTL